MASPTGSQIGAAPAEQQLLPDEILEDIFLRLDSGPDLVRASAACRAFRRVTSGHGFRRRFTSLHPPPLLGIFRFKGIEGFQGFHPFEPPHRSAPAARTVAQAADFTFSFLPDPTRWTVRDGRFLLSAKFFNTASLEFAVCDPVFRRYVLIPPIPGDLVPPMWREMESEPFLAPPGDEAGKKQSGEDSHFLVICNWRSNNGLVSCVFSGVTGKWCGAASYSFAPSNLILKPQELVHYCACSRIYWVHPSEKYMLVLDPREMKFSLDELLRPPDKTMVLEKIAIVDAEDGRIGLVTLGPRKLGLSIYSRTCQSNGDRTEAWRHDKFIPLPKPPFCYSVAGAAEGYLLLSGNPFYFDQAKRSRTRLSFDREERKTPYFAVDLKTSLVVKLYMPSGSMCHFHPYAIFPPPLSLPSL